MTKPDKNVQDAPQRPELSRHTLILSRDTRALAANQGGKADRKTHLNLLEYEDIVRIFLGGK